VKLPPRFSFVPGKEPVQGTARIADPKSGREPLVVALANLGAKDYRLKEKYLRWYTERDIPTLLFVPNGFDAALSGANRSRGHELVTVLKRLSDIDPRPIVFHTFSSEGYHLYAETLRQVTDVAGNKELRPLIKGAIVDSAPVAPTAANFVQTFTSYLHVAGLAPGYVATYKGTKTFFDIYFKFSHAPKYFLELRQFLLQKQKTPHLFMYSEMDIDTPAEQVEEYINAYKSNGASVVEAHKFKYSPNVRHMVLNHADYWNAVSGFLTKTLPLKSEL